MGYRINIPTIKGATKVQYLYIIIIDMNGMIKKIFYGANIIFPILIGVLIYYISSLGFVDSNAFVLVRGYVPDMLWAYSLVFALFCFVGNSAVLIAIPFAILMEGVQLWETVRGTFDVMDIVVEILAEAFAAFIIHKYFVEVHRNEEKK